MKRYATDDGAGRASVAQNHAAAMEALRHADTFILYTGVEMEEGLLVSSFAGSTTDVDQDRMFKFVTYAAIDAARRVEASS